MSNDQKNRTTVEIYGQKYIILSTESSNHVKQVASLVNDKMREISAKNPFLDVKKLAVLTAVNAVNDYINIKNQLERFQEELKNEKD